MSRRSILLAAFSLTLLSACPAPVLRPDDAGDDASTPDVARAPDAARTAEDAAVAAPDGGFRVEGFGLQPATGTSESERHRIRGGLRASTASAAESARYRVRGRIVPIIP